jgi:hypothetical protein
LKKILPLIFILVIFTSVISCSQASKLKTHKNENGFSFEYPSNWLISPGEDEPAEKDLLVELSGPLDAVKKGGCYVKMHLACYPPPKGRQILTLYKGKDRYIPWTLPTLQRQIEDRIVPDIAELSVRKLNVGGEPALEITTHDDRTKDPGSLMASAPVSKYIVTNYKEKQCYIWYQNVGKEMMYAKSDKGWKYVEEINQIISSFKFSK